MVLYESNITILLLGEKVTKLTEFNPNMTSLLLGKKATELTEPE
jgi:hypothetical protein